jgi:hypothetical protein
MPLLCVARLRSARGIIEWLCTQERWNPEVASILGTAARYRLANLGSSYDNTHPDNSALHAGGGSSPLRLCGQLLLHIAPHRKTLQIIRHAASFCSFSAHIFFRAGMIIHFF